MTHDLTKKQKEELKNKIQEAQDKENQDELGEFMYRVRGPPWGWYIKKIPKRQHQQKTQKMQHHQSKDILTELPKH